MSNTKTSLAIALVLSGLILVGLFLASQIDLAFSSDLETFSGPRAYPAMILSVMLLMSLITVVQSGFAHRRATKMQPDADDTPPVNTQLALLLFAVLLVFAVAFEPLGYILTMIPLMIFAARLNGAQSWLAVTLVSVLLAFTCLFIFRYALDTVLPEGLLGIDGII